MAIAPIIALRWTEINNTLHQILLVILLSILGPCLTTSQALTMAEVSNAVHEIEEKHGAGEAQGSGMGRGYAFCNMAFAAGQFVGPVLGGFSKGHFGWEVMTIILAGLCFVAGASAFLFVDGWVGKKCQTEEREDNEEVNGNGNVQVDCGENGECP